MVGSACCNEMEKIPDIYRHSASVVKGASTSATRSTFKLPFFSRPHNFSLVYFYKNYYSGASDKVHYTFSL